MKPHPSIFLLRDAGKTSTHGYSTRPVVYWSRGIAEGAAKSRSSGGTVYEVVEIALEELVYF